MKSVASNVGVYAGYLDLTRITETGYVGGVRLLQKYIEVSSIQYSEAHGKARFMKKTIEGIDFRFYCDQDSGGNWDGEVSLGDSTAEVIIEAGEDGPTPGQIARLISFRDNFDAVNKALMSHLTTYLAGLRSSAARDFVNALPVVDVLLVNAESAECDLGLAVSVSTGWFLFRKRMYFLVEMRGDRVIKFERTS